MAVNPVIWFELYVNDMGRARAFYESVFQLTLQPMSDAGMEYFAFPMQNDQLGAGGALAKMEGMAPGGGTLIYFHCDDCAVEESRVAAAGGTVIKPKMSLGAYGFMSLVLDTEGNTIGLHSQA